MRLNHDRLGKDEVRVERDLPAGRKCYKPSAGGTNFVVLDPDVARVFRDPKTVNKVLRAVMNAMGQVRLQG